MDTKNVIQMIPVEDIRPNPHNPRKNIGDVTELAQSIREQGIRQNLLVTPLGKKYVLVIGHRRLAAAQQIGLQKVPVVVAKMSEREIRELMLVENSQRVDLTPIEEADGYQGLLDLGETVDEIARKVGRSESLVRTRLKIASLPEQTRETITAKQPTIEQLEALSSITSDDLREKLGDTVGTSSWSWVLTSVQEDEKERAATQKNLAWLSDHGYEVECLPEDAENIWQLDLPDMRNVDRIDSGTTDIAAMLTSAEYDPTVGKLILDAHHPEHATTIRIYMPEPSPTPEQSEAAQEAKRLQEQYKKQHETSEKLRAAFIKKIAANKKLPTDWPSALAMLTIQNLSQYNGGAYQTLCEILNLTMDESNQDTAEQYLTTLSVEKQALLLALTAAESNTHYRDWDPDNSYYTATVKLLPALAVLGYELSDEEQQLQEIK